MTTKPEKLLSQTHALTDQRRIRNFSIIAHIDHGKSTLADRLLEITGSVSERQMREQILDSMDIERERGITIKSQTVRILYRAKDGETYTLNLIDTPGHVDFTYEVSRSLAACEGVLLVVDATQGVEAQTLANLYLALEQDLEIIPVINKIDLASADIEGTRRQIQEILGLDEAGALAISAKEGIGIEEVLEAVVERIPPPSGDLLSSFKALVVDSWFDPYQGVVVLIRLVDGQVGLGEPIAFLSTGKQFEVHQLGVFTPFPRQVKRLSVGEVGFLTASIKRIKDANVGDTLTDPRNPARQACPGFLEPKSMVFCGLYPADSGQFEELRDALDKLQLNDSSFRYEPETSSALGFGFRCGFLGLLHMDIVRERLEREFGLELVNTAPTVRYRVVKTDGEAVWVENPSRFPPTGEIASVEEPYIRMTILTPSEYVGGLLQLAQDRRGLHKGMEYLDSQKVLVRYEIPFNEIVLDFYDRLKTLSRGYASLEYEPLDYRPGKLVKLDILLNGAPVDALSHILHQDKASFVGRELIQKLKSLIHRQMFEVVIQAAIGNKVIARESVRALRKNVTAKCYGGDVTRKRKLLEKQKEGKKRMKQVGRVEVPQEAFLAILRLDQ